MDFNALSPNWDTDLRVKRAEAISAEIESYLGSGPLEMMEFGCGTGLISFHLKNKKAQFFAIEINKNMADKLKRKIVNLDIEIGSAENLPYFLRQRNITYADVIISGIVSLILFLIILC